MNAATMIRMNHRDIINLGYKIRYQIENCDELEFEESLNSLYYDFFLLVEEILL
tara:strand:+ start:13626 stop:13787 length:162 start_codon:yes stop_codon:yes gene_type:complete